MPDPPRSVDHTRRGEALGGIALATIIVLGLAVAGSAISAPLFFTSIGSSACLVLVAPGGRSTPCWAIIGGHGVTCLVGAVSLLLFPHHVLTAAFAFMVGLAAMRASRAMHPPAAANPLIITSASVPVHVSISFLLLGMILILCARSILNAASARIGNVNPVLRSGFDIGC